MDLQLEVNDLRKRLDDAEQTLAGEKARVDIAERRSIAAGEQAEALQAQVIDLNARIKKLRKGLKLVRGPRHNKSPDWIVAVLLDDDAASK